MVTLLGNPLNEIFFQVALHIHIRSASNWLIHKLGKASGKYMVVSHSPRFFSEIYSMCHSLQLKTKYCSTNVKDHWQARPLKLLPSKPGLDLTLQSGACKWTSTRNNTTDCCIILIVADTEIPLHGIYWYHISFQFNRKGLRRWTLMGFDETALWSLG